MDFNNLFVEYKSDFEPKTEDNKLPEKDLTSPIDFKGIYVPEIPKETTSDLYSLVKGVTQDSNSFDDLFDSLLFNDSSLNENKQSEANNLVNTARLFLGDDYVWGGKSPKTGFDCSGFISYVYKQNGYNIPNSTYGLFRAGKSVSLKNAKVGDIICTPGSGPSKRHVKMISRIDNGLIYTIEAKGKKYGIVETPLTNVDNIISIRRILGEYKLDTDSGKFNTLKEFVKTLNLHYQTALKKKGLDPNYSYILVAQDANESGWGKALSGNFNYGGIKGSGSRKKTFEYINGIKTPMYDSFKDFSSILNYCDYKVSLLSNNRYNAFDNVSANNPSEFIRHINDSGYSTSPSSTYVPYIMKIYNTVRKLA